MHLKFGLNCYNNSCNNGFEIIFFSSRKTGSDDLSVNSEKREVNIYRFISILFYLQENCRCLVAVPRIYWLEVLFHYSVAYFRQCFDMRGKNLRLLPYLLGP